jgi:quercetin dioxygenase-like cupin family protein
MTPFLKMCGCFQMAALLILCAGGVVCAHETPAADTTKIVHQTVVVKPLPAADKDYESLLKPPVSLRLRSGFVCLQPGKAGEEHSTEGFEEMLVILDGNGEVHFEGTQLPLGSRQTVYIPPRTTHFVKNTGTVPLRYVYVVTPVER